MTIKILCVGSIKEDYLKQGINDYLKRLQPFYKTEIIQVKEESEPKNLSEGLITKIKQQEYQRMIAKINPNQSYIVGMFIDGKQYDSISLAQQLNKWEMSNKSDLVLLIGGSNGLAEEWEKLCHEKVSFSKLTFPHQLMRLILLEQIYRCCKINHHQKYHK